MAEEEALLLAHLRSLSSEAAAAGDAAATSAADMHAKLGTQVEGVLAAERAVVRCFLLPFLLLLVSGCQTPRLSLTLLCLIHVRGLA